MNVLPFQRAWGKAKNCQSPWLSEKVWILVGVVTNVRIDSVSITADPSLPLLPFLRRSWLLILRPLPNGNGSFLVAKSDNFFQCSDGLPVGSLTWLVFRQSVDLLITSPTRAPTICLPVSWVHIGRSTYPSQKKLRQPREAKRHRNRQPREAKLQARACSREHSPVPQRRVVVSIFFGQGSIFRHVQRQTKNKI